MKIKQLIFLVVVVTCAAAFVSSGQKAAETGNSPHHVSLYDRVMKSGKIRAAYTIYPPGCFKDDNGKLKGVFVETLEEAAKNLGLTVEWTEEVGRGTQIEGLENNRFDMIGICLVLCVGCSSLEPSPQQRAAAANSAWTEECLPPPDQNPSEAGIDTWPESLFNQ
ncbi:MAG: transporter substrate-binding domain-containing protein [Verrucomicrobiota bacterium]|jgi:hypothetical protein